MNKQPDKMTALYYRRGKQRQTCTLTIKCTDYIAMQRKMGLTLIPSMQM